MAVVVFISTISANPINVSVDKKAVFSTTIDQQGRQIVIEQHPTAVDKQLPIQFVPSVSTNSVATYSLNDNDVKIISDKKTLVKPQPDTATRSQDFWSLTAQMANFAYGSEKQLRLRLRNC